MNAVIYTRVSSAKQEAEGHGNKSQEFTCTEFAKRNGYKVTKVFSDRAFSGAIEDRPEMNAMLLFLLDNPKTTVIMDDISRQARDREVYYNLKSKIQKLDCLVRFVNLDFADDDIGELVEGNLVMVANYLRKQNKAQVIRRMKARLGGGYYCWNTPPKGYKYSKNKVLEFVEPEATILKETLEKYASGYFPTQSDVFNYLIKMGVETGRANIPFLLSNPFYIGIINYEPWEIKDVEGKHPKLITKETHRKIIQRLNDLFIPHTKNLASDFPLRRYVRCKDCDRFFTACWSTNPKGVKYKYYYCQNKQCKNCRVNLNGEILENQFVEMLKSTIPSKTILELAKDIFDYKLLSIQEEQEKLQKRALDEVKKFDRQIENLWQKLKLTTNVNFAEKYEIEINKLELEKTKPRQELENLTSQNLETTVDYPTAFTKIQIILENPDKIWISGSKELKDLMLELVGNSRVVYDFDLKYPTAEKTIYYTLLDNLEAKNLRGGLYQNRTGV